MVYTIKQAAEKMGLSIYTLRYYDKEGLLPFIERDNAGNRFFTQNDMEWLEVICCLKNTGMSIKQIAKYVQACFVGDETLDIRKQMLIEHRMEVVKQITELKRNLEKIDCKIAHCNTTCSVHVEDKDVYTAAH
jgi:DNA-binding transcriptional MerR regulator